MKAGHRLWVCLPLGLWFAAVGWSEELPPEANRRYEAGMAAKKAGELQAAARELQAAVELAPKCRDARWALAWTYAALKNKRRAVDEFNWVIHAAPGSKQAQEAKAAIQRLDGEVEAPPKALSSQLLAGEERTPSTTRGQRSGLGKAEPLGGRTLMHGAQVNCIAFSPDGMTLACAAGTTMIRVVIGGNQDRQIAEPSNEVRLWDVQTGELQQTLRPHPWAATSIAFSPDGTTLAAAGTDRTVKLLDVGTGALTRTLALDAFTFIWGHLLAFSPDGRTLAVGTSNSQVQLWNVQSGELQQTLEGHSAQVLAVAFSPDGNTLATGSAPFEPMGSEEPKRPAGELFLWDVVTGELRSKLTRNPIGLCVSFSADGKTVATCGGVADGVVVICDTETGEVKRTVGGHPRPVTCVALSADAALMATGDCEGTVRLLDAGAGALRRVLTGSGAPVLSMAFSEDGKWLGAASGEAVRLWDMSAIQGTQ